MQALVDFSVQWQLNSVRVSWLYIAINGELNGGVLFLVLYTVDTSGSEIGSARIQGKSINK